MSGMATLDPDDRELLRFLFAKVTAMLEDAAVAALKGQGARVSRPRLFAQARRLSADVEAIQGLVAAMLVLTGDRRR